MLKFKDMVRYLYKYIKNMFKMNSVYDCAAPFLRVAGIFGMGGSALREIEGVRTVRNTGLSLIITVFIAFIITPASCIRIVYTLIFSGIERSLVVNVALIIMSGKYIFAVSTAAVTCVRTHFNCKNLTKVLQILHNTDMMLKQENIHVNYWKITLKTILFGLISCNYPNIFVTVQGVLLNQDAAIPTIMAFILITCEYYFMWLILFLMIIRERFVGLNKLLLQNAQIPSIMQDDSLLRRISLARDIHEQLSEAITLFSDLSRFIIIGVLVPGMLLSLIMAIGAGLTWNELHVTAEGVKVTSVYILLVYFYFVVHPIIKTVILTAVCEGYKNNRRVLNARLRYLISREEDPRTVHQLKQYIWYQWRN